MACFRISKRFFIDEGNYYRVDNSDGNVIYADSCSYEDVKAAVEAAKSGDTVRVPSGEAICDSYQDFSWSERWFV
ncbi:MAG: hypothetical protein ACLFPF_07985 [Halanaerobiales bacterium]